MDERWDLIVGGGGPSGCVLAAKTAGLGARVLLLEARDEFGEGRDWIVDVGGDTFKKAGVPAPLADELFHEPDISMLLTSDRSVSVELLPAPMVPVRNGPYVRRLASWARQSGVECRTGVEVVGTVLEGGAVAGLRARIDGELTEFRSTVCADCTGLAGAIRRSTPEEWGISRPVDSSDIVLARRETRLIDRAGAEGAMADGFMRDKVRFDRVGSQGVYSVDTCYLDLERGFVDILLGSKPGSGPTPEERFARILEERTYIGEKVFGDGGPIPISRPLDTLAADGLVVLGDSACQVIPAHGSGTASAIIAADLAAPVVMRAIETGRARRADLWGYCHAFQSGRGALLAYYDVIRRHTDVLNVHDMDRMISSGLITPGEIYSGLVPEVPKFGLGDIGSRLGAAVDSGGLLADLARSGMLANRTLEHYRMYPPLDLPGALQRWSRSMP
jgi:flavin-dependent dehydrogenase